MPSSPLKSAISLGHPAAGRVAKNRTPVQQKVGDYFVACMNTAAIDALGDKPVLPALRKIDGLTTRAALAQVGVGGLGLPDRDYYVKTDARSVTIREQYLA